MGTLLLGHSDCLLHRNPAGHPERVERLVAVNDELDGAAYSGLIREDAPLVEDEAILRVHPEAYLRKLEKNTPQEGLLPLDADTVLGPHTLVAARRAAGAIVRAVDQVMDGAVRNGFCAVRPPGHHAETSTPMGFCYLGTVVIGARHALDVHNLERVAIVDFDVHHGNGTQDLVWEDERILFASTHQMPLYPGSGARNERGKFGQIVNAPLSAGADGVVFRQVMEDVVLPAVDAHKPQMIFISAGFDAHADDPLASLNLVEEDFAWATGRICDLAEKHCNGRVVSTLEGGYDLPALASSVGAHVKVLMERGNG